ncbi:hypothetical protein PROFUN_17078, partial [Planoprotostelium fungivorum]
MRGHSDITDPLKGVKDPLKGVKDPLKGVKVGEMVKDHQTGPPEGGQRGQYIMMGCWMVGTGPPDGGQTGMSTCEDHISTMDGQKILNFHILIDLNEIYRMTYRRGSCSISDDPNVLAV